LIPIDSYSSSSESILYDTKDDQQNPNKILKDFPNQLIQIKKKKLRDVKQQRKESLTTPKKSKVL